MLASDQVVRILEEAGVGFYSGVPDSLLKDFCAYITDHAGKGRHVITANEGGAIALAAGHHLATGTVPLVYMQNSGQGNAVNPLASLADPDVYGIPMVLLIGWRGEPGVSDEPQHVKQGKITLELLDTLGISYEVLPTEPEAAAEALRRSVATARQTSAPVAIVVRKGTFEKYSLQTSVPAPYSMDRESVIRHIVDHLDSRDIVVSTTGKPSRELFEYRARSGGPPGRDFYTVGSMGHASQIALGVAEAKPDRRVWCLDGDGALIMHMGSLAVIGQCRPHNFCHIVLNNGAHDSVGGQSTAGFSIDIAAIARACGYRWAACVETPEDLATQLAAGSDRGGPWLLEVRIAKGARSDLGRPTSTPAENKQAFMKFVA